MGKILTISIAAYNSEKYLRKCLDSFVCCKEIEKLEVLVINDGSTDTTRQIAGEYQSSYPESITVINKENGGHGSTINTSIKLATGKYFKLVDADDWVYSEGLDKLVRFLEGATADLVLNPYIKVNPGGEITQFISCVKQFNTVEYCKEYEIGEIENAIDLDMHASTFRTDILRQDRKLISEHCFYVDNEYILYPIPYVKRVVFQDYVVYRYLFGRPDQSANKQSMIDRRNQYLHVLKKLIQFYYSHKNGTGLDLIYNNISNMIRTHYSTYFRMKNVSTGKKELVQFDKYLKKYDLYSYVVTQYKGKTTIFLRFMRKTKFRGYEFVMTVLHLLRFYS